MKMHKVQRFKNSSIKTPLIKEIGYQDQAEEENLMNIFTIATWNVKR